VREKLSGPTPTSPYNFVTALVARRDNGEMQASNALPPTLRGWYVAALASGVTYLCLLCYAAQNEWWHPISVYYVFVQVRIEFLFGRYTTVHPFTRSESRRSLSVVHFLSIGEPAYLTSFCSFYPPFALLFISSRPLPSI